MTSGSEMGAAQVSQEGSQLGKAQGPLCGVKVLDLSSVVLGPYATMILGDLGADVLKVESPQGDIIRHVAPARNPGMGAVFMGCNRNKRSIVLDLKREDSRAVLQDLVRDADVLIHSMRPKAIRRLGLDYASLAPLNPRLIYCNAWGFRQDGPYGDRPAYDDVIQSLSGLAELASRRGGEPQYAPTVVADKTTGLTAAYAILAALFHQSRTGQGQEVEVPMLESMASFLLLEHLAAGTFRPAMGPLGYDRALSPHRRPYATRDGYMAVMPYTTDHWQRFFRVAGAPEMADDPRVADTAERSRHIGMLYGMVADLIATRPTAEWVRILDEADIPSVPIQSIEDLPNDPHLTATGFFVDYEHPSEGPLRTTAPPTLFSATPLELYRAPPRLGEHTTDVLRELGYAQERIDALIGSGAVCAEPARTPTKTAAGPTL